MTIDQELRRASNTLSRATEIAEFTVVDPSTTRRLLHGPVVGAAVAAAVLMIVGIPAVFLLGQPDVQSSGSAPGAGSPPTSVALSESGIENALVGPTEATTREEEPGTASEDVEPRGDAWVPLADGVAFAWIPESPSVKRLWARSNVADPTPAPSTDTLTMFVAVDNDRTAMLINAAYEHPSSVEAVLSDGTVVSINVSWDNPDIGVVIIPSPFDPLSDTVTLLP